MAIELKQETIDQISQKGRDSLFFFCRAILGFDLLTSEIHRPICIELEKFKENPREVVILPRDWFKSTIASIGYPLWRAVNNPNIRILITQNSFSNACKKLYNIRQLVEGNQLFRACYPEVLPNRNSVWKTECLTLNRKIAAPEGTFEAAGIGTSVVSRHYDLVIEDDTVSPSKDALTGIMMQPTKAEVEKAIGWHRLVHPLLIHPRESQILIVGTRWAERDLLSWVVENNPSYHVITRAVRENTEGVPDPKGHIVWDRFDAETLSDLERDLGPYMFSALYMNNPTSASNQVFQRKWINYYNELPTNLLYCTSVDPAASDMEGSEDPDYNVVMTTGINPTNGHIYVAEYSRERMTPSQLIAEIFRHEAKYHPIEVVIEAISYQRTLCHWLERQQNKLGRNFLVNQIKGLKGSKEDRIRALQPFFANNRIFIKVEHDHLERELLAFPKGSHDDLPDALQLQLSFWGEVNAEHKVQEYKMKMALPNSGLSILNEIKKRNNKSNNYRFDMGNRKDLINPKYVRPYYGQLING